MQKNVQSRANTTTFNTRIEIVIPIEGGIIELSRIDFWEDYVVFIGSLDLIEGAECISRNDFQLQIGDKLIKQDVRSKTRAEYGINAPGRGLFTLCATRESKTLLIPFSTSRSTQSLSFVYSGQQYRQPLSLSQLRAMASEPQPTQTPTSTSTSTPTRTPTATKTPKTTQTPLAASTSSQAPTVPQSQTFTTTTNANANLYDTPSSGAQAVAGTYAGDTINVVKVDSSGDWYQLDNGYWISAAQTNRPTISEVTSIAAVAEEPILMPTDVSYTIINEYTIPDIKRSLDIRLTGRAPETQLRSIALEIKNSDSATYDRTFIVYLLPDMIVEAGAWATTHFNPDLEVEIIGLTIEEALQLTDIPDDPSQATIGTWLNDGPYIGNKTTIYSEADRFFMDEKYLDGSMGTRELIEEPSSEGRKFIDPECCGFGEFYLIGPKGHLQIWDENGQISTALTIADSSGISGHSTLIQVPATPQQVQSATQANTATSTPQLPTAIPASTATSTQQAPAATPTHTTTTTRQANSSRIIVTNIVDGDTIKVQINGVIQTVRYIGIDTPESGQPGYQSATEANRALVQGQIVTLQKDRSETDQYGRLLRYVYLTNGTMVNQQLLALGMAQPVEYEADTTQAASFLSTATNAAN